MTPELHLFDSLTRSMRRFEPLREGEARVYSCGPTVYAHQHVGNMRAYLFADTLGRALTHFGYRLRHVVNITDVGHLTSDADAGADKMERAAAATGQSAWDIAAHYTALFEADLARLNIRPLEHPRATDHVEGMIAWAQGMEQAGYAYRLPGGLYFDTARVPDYGRLARAGTSELEGEGRIEEVAGKRHAADFALWRTTPPGESRQMEWDSPWGRGAPGWHIECSVMSAALLGHPFDIHTGGIDHREIHHPNEIAQNQAHAGCADSGATLWMHNNFLVDRRGKMSKSSGEFLTLQTLVDRGYHPLAYRMLCLQAHYRSELEFTWEGLGAALTRLKRLVMAVEKLRGAQAQGSDDHPRLAQLSAEFDAAIADDLNSAVALTLLEQALGVKGTSPAARLALAARFDAVLGLDLDKLTRADLRVRPVAATIDRPAIDAALARRRDARAAKDFATSDAVRDELAAAGVEVMDGDPLGWDWRLD